MTETNTTFLPMTEEEKDDTSGLNEKGTGDVEDDTSGINETGATDIEDDTSPSGGVNDGVPTTDVQMYRHTLLMLIIIVSMLTGMRKY